MEIESLQELLVEEMRDLSARATEVEEAARQFFDIALCLCYCRRSICIS